MKIAISGKGGVGKTTVAGLIVRELVERGDGPVLAIDADPQYELPSSLGIDRRAHDRGAARGDAAAH